jgi:hypothetical protein
MVSRKVDMKTKLATSADGTFHKSLKGFLIDHIKTSIPILKCSKPLFNKNTLT